MKKRTVITVVALALSAILSLSMIGCGDGTHYNDLRETAKQAGLYLYQNYKNYDVYGEVKVDYNSSSLIETYSELTYKPSAEAETVTEPVKVSVVDVKTTATVQVKRIDNVLNLEVTYNTQTKTTTQEVNSENLLDKTETTTVETEVYYFGKTEDTYYVRLTESQKTGDEPIVETKTYQVFATETAYQTAVQSLLDDIAEEYVEDSLNMCGSAQLYGIMGISPEVSKKRDNYTLKAKIDMFNVNSGVPTDSVMEMIVKINPTGVQEIKMENKQNVVDRSNSHLTASAIISYASGITAPVNPIDGYTLGTVSYSGIIPNISVGSIL